MNRSRPGLDFPARSRLLAPIASLVPIIFFFLQLSAQTPWNAVGPAGGDARSLAAVPGHPEHLYLGGTSSWIYESMNGGASWRRLAKLEADDGLVLDHIVVDPVTPATVYAAAWKINETGGGLWVSHDGGTSWKATEGLRGQSIRSFAQAPSDPKMLFAGSLEGVFRSSDAGATWVQISPPGSREIHEIESLAIDPTDPNIVYAGTWHLPWKTEDGGKSWKNIKEGVIDDSDVFSIIIDPARPQTVYASACSGIYKSENAGELFEKIKGIPATANRTRVLRQSPGNREVVYAGTTEGLYKTEDGGRSFQALTGPEVIVNDIFVDPANADHLLLATDRGGVLASQDGGKSFASANEGFSERKVEALLLDQGTADRANSARWFAGVANDKSFGGVFLSTDSGASWQQTGADQRASEGGGLQGRDVFALALAPDGSVVAGTSHGIFALAASTENAAALWQPRNRIVNTIVKTATETHYGKSVRVERRTTAPVIELDSRITALDLSGDAWLAAATGGLYTSRDQGASWQGGPVMGSGGYLSVASLHATMAAARGDGVVLSDDAGLTWMPIRIPAMLTRIHRVAFSADGTLWLGAREGVYFTHDLGRSWLWIARMPFRDVDDLYYDAHLDRVLVSSESSDQVYAIDPKTLHWRLWQTGYRIGLIRAAGDRLVAASLYDGVLVEPQARER